MFAAQVLALLPADHRHVDAPAQAEAQHAGQWQESTVTAEQPHSLQLATATVQQVASVQPSMLKLTSDTSTTFVEGLEHVLAILDQENGVTQVDWCQRYAARCSFSMLVAAMQAGPRMVTAIHSA